MDFKEKNLIQRGNISFLPVIHGKLEFSSLALRIFDEIQPDAVAVEFPKTLAPVIEKALDRLPFISVVLYEEKDGRSVYLPIEPQDPLVASAWLARRRNIPLFHIDRDTEGYPRNRESLPDPYSVVRLGLASYVKAYTNEFSNLESNNEDRLREMTMAYHLQDIAQKFKNVLCVCGLAHYSAIIKLLDEKAAMPLGRTKRKGVTLANLAEESSREIMNDMPFLCAAFVRAAQMSPDPGTSNVDRLLLHQDLINLAKAEHFKNSKDEITPAQSIILNKFARNYALVQGYLTPDLYQLLIAARGSVDDNFAYEVWNLGTEYPWQDKDSDLPTLRLRGEDLFLDTKKIKFYRRFRQFRRRLVPVPVKKRKKENKPGEWKEGWEGFNICSYPPEDIVIEGFGDYLKKKTLQILSEENRRTQPFTTSMLDGLDMRETIRNWYEGKLYVTENRQVQGKVGSVVLIFDGDEGESEQYPWRMTWLGEHEQESDMAFYATPAGVNLTGPGISRCEYGGFMLSYPPLRMYDIWRDSFFDAARTKSERLLLAGIDYSEEKLIAYIAAKPPAGRIKSIANLYGKKVIYLPIGQFSPVTLKKTRVFHVLDGHKVRSWAGEYVY